MNKLVFSIALILTIGISNLLAQCTPDPFAFLPISPLTDTTEVNVAYSQAITISVPQDTTITIPPFGSQQVVINKMTITPAPPAGWTTACDIGSCTWFANTKGCILITGMATTVGTITIPMNISINYTWNSQTGDFNSPNPVPYNIYAKEASTAVENVLDVNAFRFAPCSPSPADGNTTLSFSSPVATDLALSMYDLSGAIVKTTNIRANAGINKSDLNVSGIASGMYIVSLNNGTRVLTQRLIVK